MANDSHEALVEAFLAQARLDDPERYAAVCARHPVRSKRQMRTIAEIEIPAGLQPIKLRRHYDAKPIRTRHDIKQALKESA